MIRGICAARHEQGTYRHRDRHKHRDTETETDTETDTETEKERDRERDKDKNNPCLLQQAPFGSRLLQARVVTLRFRGDATSKER